MIFPLRKLHHNELIKSVYNLNLGQTLFKVNPRSLQSRLDISGTYQILSNVKVGFKSES